MGFIKNLFSRNKKEYEMSAEEKERLDALLKEKNLADDEFDDEYIDDISVPEIIHKSSVENQNSQVVSEKITKEKDSIIVEPEESIKDESKVDMKTETIESLTSKNLDSMSYDEVLTLKKLLEKKEREFEEKQNSNEESVIVKKDSRVRVKEVREVIPEFNKNIQDKDLEYEIYEVSEYGIDALEKINVTKNVSSSSNNNGIEIEHNKIKKDEVMIIENDETEKNSNEENAELINKLRDIFTDENLFFKESKKITYDMLNGEDVTCIGIRKKEAHFSWESIAEQNAWFISKIKKLDELKNFKVIRSEEGIKDLVWNKDHPILISYRSVNNVPNHENFDFPEKE